MNIKTVYQIDRSGMYQGTTLADESPLEPGVWHMPARTIEEAPPPTWPEESWPRWNGTGWVMATKPTPETPVETDPVQKMLAFLQENPDVAAYLETQK